MPVYNAGKDLRLAVLSILAQTYPYWELLIIDDKSTDSCLDNIADIMDPRIRILRDGSNMGLAARLNQAIDMANGEFLARMDQDDISYPERFARELALLSSKPELDLVAVRAIRISEKDELLGFFPSPLNHSDICARPWQGFYFPHPTWMGRIAWFRKHRYRIPQSYFCEDQELLLRSYRDSKFACVPEVLFAYRIRDKIDPRKLRKTRLAVFKIQMDHFIKTREFHFLVLALAGLSLRIGIDFIKQLKRGFVSGTDRKRPIEDVQSESTRWEQLRLSLAACDAKSNNGK